MHGRWYYLLPSDEPIWVDLQERVLAPLIADHADESEQQLVLSAFVRGMWEGLAVGDGEKRAVLGLDAETIPRHVNVLSLFESMLRSFQRLRLVKR